MAITGTYPGTQYTNIKGYRLSASLTPNLGFQGNLWVNVLDVVDAAQRPVPMNLNGAGPPPTGALLLNGDHRTYQFPNITLQSVEPGATRRERFRLAEFNYPHVTGMAQAIPASFQNTGTMLLQPGALQGDYVWGIDQFPQHLLGFQARLSANDSVVVRFASLRNAKNSLFARSVQLNNDMMGSANQAMPDLSINFAQGNLVLTAQNLVHLFVVELYGEALKWPLPTLSDFVRPDAGPGMARLNPPCYSAHELVRHEIERGYHAGANNFTVEIATIVFVPGYYRNLLIG